MRKYLAAFTELGCEYPSYVSINQEGDEVSFTVRAPKNLDGSCGTTVTAKCPAVVFELMLEDIKKNYVR